MCLEWRQQRGCVITLGGTQKGAEPEWMNTPQTASPGPHHRRTHIKTTWSSLDPPPPPPDGSRLSHLRRICSCDFVFILKRISSGHFPFPHAWFLTVSPCPPAHAAATSVPADAVRFISKSVFLNESELRSAQFPRLFVFPHQRWSLGLQPVQSLTLSTGWLGLVQ